MPGIFLRRRDGKDGIARDCICAVESAVKSVLVRICLKGYNFVAGERCAVKIFAYYGSGLFFKDIRMRACIYKG